MSATLVSLIQEINDAGFLINNLCQLEQGRWRASVRLDITFEFGEGTGPQSALESARDKIITPVAKARGASLTKKLSLEEIGL